MQCEYSTTWWLPEGWYQNEWKLKYVHGPVYKGCTYIVHGMCSICNTLWYCCACALRRINLRYPSFAASSLSKANLVDNCFQGADWPIYVKTPPVNEIEYLFLRWVSGLRGTNCRLFLEDLAAFDLDTIASNATLLSFSRFRCTLFSSSYLRQSIGKSRTFWTLHVFCANAKEHCW